MTSATIRPPTGPRSETVLDQLRLLEHVVPERRRTLEPEPIAVELVEVGRSEGRNAHLPSERLAGWKLPGHLPEQRPHRQRGRAASGSRSRRSAGGRAASRCCVSIRLFGFTWPSPKSKNVCQPTKRRGARTPPRRSSGSGPLFETSKMSAEERLARRPRRGSPGRKAAPSSDRSGTRRPGTRPG